MSELQQLHDAILDGDAGTAKSVTEKAIAENVAPMDLITGYMMPAMDSQST